MKEPKLEEKSFPLVLGVDPGTRITGYGLISLKNSSYEAVDFGCIRPPPSRPLSVRYRILFEGIGVLLDKYAPSALAIETQYIDRNPQSGIKLGMARGVILLAATLRQIPVFEYPPTRAKKAVVGTGKASKVQVQGMVQRLLSLRCLPEPEDAADALALAICHAHTVKRAEHEKHQI